MIEKPSRHHLSQVNKASITSNNVYRHYAHYVYDAMRKARPFSGIPAQNVWPESNHERTSDKHKSRDILQNNWQVFIESVEIMKDKERQRNCHRLEETKKRDN